MNTKHKIIASSVVNAIPAYFFKDKNDSFGVLFTMFSIISVSTIITDKLINQNITSNKAIQYGMLAAETVLELGIVTGLSKAQKNEKFSVNEFKGFFSALFSTDFEAHVITAGAIGFSLIHKYIWDQPNESVEELDQNSGIPIDILGAEI